MRYPNCFDDSLRWRAVIRFEASQSLVEVTRRLQVISKVASRFWNQFQTKDTVTRKVGQSHHIATTPAQNRHLVENKGGTLFSVMSRDSPDRVILVESSSGKKVELAHFHSSYLTEIDRFGGEGILVWGG
ncbi:hypothetical protein TNCV_4456511 [Trichonephila clavipes]|nr:hypothetical protein TNCV_4456511 [Trichonephila clavipes]